jgi:hypothetical protein
MSSTECLAAMSGPEDGLKITAYACSAEVVRPRNHRAFEMHDWCPSGAPEAPS